MVQILNILLLALQFYSFALIIYIFMSWFPGARESSFGVMLANICEPYLEIFRKFIPPLGMIDLSPLVAIIVLRFASTGLGTFFQMFLL